MDVHQRFRTEAHQNVVPRFNERFLLSLSSCKRFNIHNNNYYILNLIDVCCCRCLIVDDQLAVLPLSSHNIHVTPVEPSQEPTESEVELTELKGQLRDTQPVGNLVNCCKTLDQAKAVLKFIEAISEKTLRYVECFCLNICLVDCFL